MRPGPRVVDWSSFRFDAEKWETLKQGDCLTTIQFYRFQPVPTSNAVILPVNKQTRKIKLNVEGTETIVRIDDVLLLNMDRLSTLEINKSISCPGASVYYYDFRYG